MTIRRYAFAPMGHFTIKRTWGSGIFRCGVQALLAGSAISDPAAVDRRGSNLANEPASLPLRRQSRMWSMEARRHAPLPLPPDD